MEGRNLVVKRAYAEYSVDRLPGLVAERPWSSAGPTASSIIRITAVSKRLHAAGGLRTPAA